MSNPASPTLEPIWKPSDARLQRANMTAFMSRINERIGTGFTTYDELWSWSVDDVASFWRETWDYLDIVAHQRGDTVVDDPARLPGAAWFPGTTMNFAENLLRGADDDEAIVFCGEHMIASGTTRRLTYRELREQVRRFASYLGGLGVEPGDRVVGYLPNLPETVVAMLGATSLGATWSSCSPDFGVKGVLDRFARIQPKVLVTADGYFYNGRTFDSLGNVREICDALETPPAVVVVPYASETPDLSPVPGAVLYPEALAGAPDEPLQFTSVPFEQPLYIMYSSGTTGLPKCIVQSVGGVLLNQKKELVLHTDLRPEDRIFYFTTCGWMMWNWLVCSLSVGATIVLFDGSPFAPDATALMRLAEREKVTVFGASAKYYAALEKAGVRPGASFDLGPLHTILSTGSPLLDESFDYLYREVKADLCVSSISGGTDLNGCFVGGNPILPVYRGEIQSRCLGMAVDAFGDDGQSLDHETGELVCTKAFPSMPIHFWDDDDGSAYHRAYFDRFPGIWCHGDFIEINEHSGVRIFGRSDATLNPGGVRIGTSEIYRQVEPLDEIADSVVIGQQWDDDVRVVLFVQLADGAELTPQLAKRIRTAIRSNCSPRHVPARIIAVDDIPYTISMKKVELAVRDIVHGREVKNRDALKNPEALKCFENLAELAG